MHSRLISRGGQGAALNIDMGSTSLWIEIENILRDNCAKVVKYDSKQLSKPDTKLCFTTLMHNRIVLRGPGCPIVYE